MDAVTYVIPHNLTVQEVGHRKQDLWRGSRNCLIIKKGVRLLGIVSPAGNMQP